MQCDSNRKQPNINGVLFWFLPTSEKYKLDIFRGNKVQLPWLQDECNATVCEKIYLKLLLQLPRAQYFTSGLFLVHL